MGERPFVCPEIHAQEQDVGIVLAAFVPSFDEIAPELVEPLLAGLAGQRATKARKDLVALALESGRRAAELGKIALGMREEPDRTVRILVELRAHRHCGSALAVELEEEEGRICQCLPELFLEFVGVPCGVFHGVSLSWIYPINVRARGSVPDRVIGG